MVPPIIKIIEVTRETMTNVTVIRIMGEKEIETETEVIEEIEKGVIEIENVLVAVKVVVMEIVMVVVTVIEIGIETMEVVETYQG